MWWWSMSHILTQGKCQQTQKMWIFFSTLWFTADNHFPLGVLSKCENKYVDVIAIMEHPHQYVSERGRRSQRIRCNSIITPSKQISGLVPTSDDWHTKVVFLTVTYWLYLLDCCIMIIPSFSYHYLLPDTHNINHLNKDVKCCYFFSLAHWYFL